MARGNAFVSRETSFVLAGKPITPLDEIDPIDRQDATVRRSKAICPPHEPGRCGPWISFPRATRPPPAGDEIDGRGWQGRSPRRTSPTITPHRATVKPSQEQLPRSR